MIELKNGQNFWMKINIIAPSFANGGTAWRRQVFLAAMGAVVKRTQFDNLLYPQESLGRSIM